MSLLDVTQNKKNASQFVLKIMANDKCKRYSIEINNILRAIFLNYFTRALHEMNELLNYFMLSYNETRIALQKSTHSQ